MTTIERMEELMLDYGASCIERGYLRPLLGPLPTDALGAVTAKMDATRDALLSAIRELVSERDRLEQYRLNYEAAMQGALSNREDAERYRWLRNGGDYTLACINPDVGQISSDNLDAVIDGALKRG